MNDHYQLWSKAGLTPNYKVDQPEIYLENFNWFLNWFNSYFFNKVSDFLIGVMLLCISIFYIFSNKIKEKKKINNSQYIYLTYFFLVLLFIEWFLNHPALRYGGYIIIILLIFIPLSIILEKYQIPSKQIKSKLKFIILITIIIFISRNALRINNEKEKYNYKPITVTFYQLDDTHFRISELIDKTIQNHHNCKNKLEECNPKLFKKVKEFNINRYLFIND